MAEHHVLRRNERFPTALKRLEAIPELLQEAAEVPVQAAAVQEVTQEAEDHKNT